MKYFIIIELLIVFPVLAMKSNNPYKKDSIETIITNEQGQGLALEVHFIKGKEHSHAIFAIWIEDLQGNYIQTLYVSKSAGTGYFKHGVMDSDKWLPGPVNRPAIAPYWAHKRNILSENGSYMPTLKNPVPDAYTGATPKGSFILKTKTDKKPPAKFNLFIEINQPFDFNEYWTTTKYLEDEEYHTSGQPASIYFVTIDTSNPEDIYYLHLIGHSSYNGSNGYLYSNTNTLTTAKEIVKELTVKILSK
ncbi:MAG: hypothetical protein Kow0068_07960 [Marinilabiliales bacterium]